MKNWQQIIDDKLGQQKNNIANINLEKETVSYSEKIKHNCTLKSLTGDEEIVRAFLIDHLVNEDYSGNRCVTDRRTVKLRRANSVSLALPGGFSSAFRY